MTWYPYVTRSAHGSRPAGAEVRVRESPGNWELVEMDYGDGDLVVLMREAWDFPGTPLRGGDIVALEDARSLRHLDLSIPF